MTTMFGAEIKTARENHGLSLSEAGELIGCTKNHLSEMEHGKSTNPTIKTLAGIATTYGLALSYLVEVAAISSDGIERRTAVVEYMKAREVLKPQATPATEFPRGA